MEQRESVSAKDRYRRVSEIFAATFELEGTAREEALRDACGDDPELRAEVEAMLDSHDRHESFLGIPPLGRALDQPEPAAGNEGGTNLIGSRIGDCRLLRIIGSGGMGTVYEARQDNPERTVAVKVMSVVHASRSALQRFEYEAQVLGQLCHPGIAQVYEAGTYTDEGDGSRGRPYFVMEFVANAMSVTRYADANELDLDERLALFAKICDAVQHGHQKGIIHRDLKPDNILVDERGQPKIIDFGVARATDSDLRRTTLRTDVGQLIGTLQYMSPEQCAADPHELDTRSDVYSLGLLLYELLSGRLPYDVSTLAIHEAVQIIRSGASTRLSSTGRSMRGDLDTITSKALEKDPERRYATAAELGQDVRRYLGHEVILARPPSAIYQIRKFARRNRALVGGFAAVFVALLLGIVGTSWQAVQAEDARAAEARQREKAERDAAVKTAVFEFMHDTLTGFTATEEELTVREMLDRAAVTIESAYANDPIVEADVRDMIQYMYQTLGRFDLAEPHALRRVALLKTELGPDHEVTLIAQGALAWIWQKQDRPVDGEEFFERLLEDRRARLGEEAVLTLEAKNNLAMNYCAQGRVEEAESMMREVLSTRRRLGNPDDSANLNNLGLILLNSERPEQAVEIFADLEQRYRVSDGEPTAETLVTTLNLTRAYKASGRLSEAAEKASELLSGCRQVLGPTHPDTLRAFHELAATYDDMQEYGKSLAVYDEFLAAQRDRYGDFHPDVAETLHHRADCAMRDGQPELAHDLAREALDIYYSLPSVPPNEVRHATEVLYSILQNSGTPEDRRLMLEEALDYQRGNVEAGHIDLIFMDMRLGFERLQSGELEEAVELLREALEIAAHYWPPGSVNYGEVVDTTRLLGEALLEGERYAEAEPVLLDAHAMLSTQGSSGANRAAARERLFLLYESWGKPEQAGAWRAK